MVPPTNAIAAHPTKSAIAYASFSQNPSGVKNKYEQHPHAEPTTGTIHFIAVLGYFFGLIFVAILCKIMTSLSVLLLVKNT